MASVSVIVPTLNEASTIVGTVHRLRALCPEAEILVVDGGSDDGTTDLVRGLATLVRAPRGRGRQLNAGARAASGDVLWFVHADTRIHDDGYAQLIAAISDPAVLGGGFTLAFDRRSPGLNALAWTSNQRARRLGWIFGDQAMFVRRNAFARVGGFPDLPLMEDLEMSRRLRAVGRLVVLPATSTASSRRFDVHGPWSMLIYMQWLKLLYFRGVAPSALLARYVAGPPWRRLLAGRAVPLAQR